MNLEHIKQKFKSGNEIPVPGAYVTQEEFQFLLSKLQDEQGASSPVANKRVLVQFGDVGCAGPFPVVDGRIVLSSVTMNDLAYRMASAPVAETGVKQALKLVAELRDTAFKKGICPDSGACHHGCRTRCARQHDFGCVPLSVSGLGDDWKLDIERGASAPVAGEAQEPIGFVDPVYVAGRQRGMKWNAKIYDAPTQEATAPLYAAPQASEVVRDAE